MLQAMNTGHEGSLATIHANTPRDALSRLENMVGMAGVNLTPRAIRQQICSAITVILQASRLTDGTRKLVSMQEITGMEGDIISMQEIFRFEQTGIDADGKVQGHFCATGVRPRFAERLRMFGAAVPKTLRSRPHLQLNLAAAPQGAMHGHPFYGFVVFLFAAVILGVEGAYLWWVEHPRRRRPARGAPPAADVGAARAAASASRSSSSAASAATTASTACCTGSPSRSASTACWSRPG
jgi:hypothetical protein